MPHEMKNRRRARKPRSASTQPIPDKIFACLHLSAFKVHQSKLASQHSGVPGIAVFDV